MQISKSKKLFEEDADKLINLAISVYKTDLNLANRYTEIAYNILVSHRIKFGYRKFLICKRCKHLLVPGSTANVEFRHKSIIYKCLNCNKVITISYEKRI